MEQVSQESLQLFFFQEQTFLDDLTIFEEKDRLLDWIVVLLGVTVTKLIVLLSGWIGALFLLTARGKVTEEKYLDGKYVKQIQ